MKKLIAFVLALACVLGVAGCKSTKSSDISKNNATETQESQQTTETSKQNAEVEEGQQTTAPEENEPAVITPLLLTIDFTKLENCIVAISLEKGDFYTDMTGAVMMDATVFLRSMYDLVDVALMKEGDTILRYQEEILISSIERDESGTVLINGGPDEGGLELYTEEDTVYFERGYSDMTTYYELGKISFPVSPDFMYNDASDMDKEATIFRAEDFLNDAAGIDYHFNPNNTTIQIEDGYVTSMTRVYIPQDVQG